MITKAVTTLITALFAATFVFATSASAGGCGKGFKAFKGASYGAKLRAKKAAKRRQLAAAKRRKIAAAKRRQKIAAAKRARAAKLAAAKKAKAQQVAAAKKAQENAKVAEVAKVEDKSSDSNTETETSTLKVASADPVKTCTKFIAATGTTVEIECAAQ